MSDEPEIVVDDQRYRVLERVTFEPEPPEEPPVPESAHATLDTSRRWVIALGIAMVAVTIVYAVLVLTVIPLGLVVASFAALGALWVLYAAVAILAAGYSNRPRR